MNYAYLANMSETRLNKTSLGFPPEADSAPFVVVATLTD